MNWRNDPEVWKLTGSHPDKHITEKMERDWIMASLKNANSIRFAICIENSQEYIGNVQLTAIKEDNAELEIFIGNKAYWSKGIATSAIRQILQYAKREINLKYVFSVIKRENIASIKAFKKNGFVTEPYSEEQLSIKLYLALN